MSNAEPNRNITFVPAATASGSSRPAQSPEDPARLEIRDLSKSFGASRALAGVSLSVAPGEVHALVGENGSGKSTLVKLLSGYHAPDPGGSLLVDGEHVELPLSTDSMRRHRLSVVHQDLGLLDSFTVVENMRVGQFGVRRFSRAIRWRRERELACASLASLGADIDPDAPVSRLSAAQRAEVAIARALQHHEPGRGLVMFDESTRALPPEPREHFHSLSREVAVRGGSVLLVSHQLEEVLTHADRVSVLRDGKLVASAVPTGDLSEHELIRMMLGRELLHRPRRSARAQAREATAGAGDAVGREVAAAVRDLTGEVLAGASFAVAPGEVLGVTGLLGSGFEELPYLISGAQRARGGTLLLDGRSHDLRSSSLRDLLRAGVALVPERRGSEGLALSESVLENVTLPRVRSRGSRLRTGGAWQRAEADWVLRTLGVRPSDPGMIVGRLSGGNQQRVLIGKWLCASPRLLLLHEPTQGVDVGARREIELALVRGAESGCGVVLAGMDVGELAALCDRVLVTREGQIAAELDGDLTPERIVDAVYAGRSVAGAA